jgi:hypothetical protein
MAFGDYVIVRVQSRHRQLSGNPAQSPLRRVSFEGVLITCKNCTAPAFLLRGWAD